MKHLTYRLAYQSVRAGRKYFFQSLIIVFLLFQVFDLCAQHRDTTFHNFWEKVYFGGNFGLSFGDYTYLEFSPSATYRFTQRVHGGVGITYRYLKDNRFNYSTSAYGGRIFGRYFIFENVFVHTEYDWLNWEPPRPFRERIDVFSVLVGGGYFQRLGSNFFVNILLLYNLNDSPDSPYQNPVFRMGFGLGF